jgi:hypothetical protein
MFKSFYFIFCFVLSVIIGCNCNNIGLPEGGPCTYETKNYPAIVIGIEKQDSLNADIIFKIETGTGEVYHDSVSWYMENNSWILISQIEKDSISIGKKYKYRLDFIKTGSCNPHIERLTLEKFQ